MKLSDIRPCDQCGGKIAPMFYVVKSSIAMFNRNAVNEQLGLVQMFGGGGAGIALAEVMGAHGNDVVMIAGDEDEQLWFEFYLCQDCFMGPVNLAVLMEKSAKSQVEDEDASRS